MIRSPELPPPLLDEAQSERWAYKNAVAAGNNAALIMFLARNPDSRYATKVRKLLAARHRPDPSGTAAAVAGNDADVVRAFDAARLSANPADLRAFLARHGSHPLSSEARLLLAR